MFIQSEAEVDHDVFLAFEFSHIVIFFAALFFIIEAFFLMGLNQRLKMNIDIASAMSSEDMLKKYEQEKGHMNTQSRWRPFQYFRDTMEYKVYNVFFCKTYGLPLSIFDFASYMREVLDKHVTEMIEVEVSSWVLLCLFLCVNVIRHELTYGGDGEEAVDGHRRSLAEFTTDAFFHRGLASAASEPTIYCDFKNYTHTHILSHTHNDTNPPSGHDHHDHGHHERFLAGGGPVEQCCVWQDAASAAAHRALAGGGSSDAPTTPSGLAECNDGETGIVLFMLCGWFLLGFVTFLAILARRCELKLLSTIGCKNADDYAKYVGDAEAELKKKEEEMVKKKIEEETASPLPRTASLMQNHKRMSRNQILMLEEMKHIKDEAGGHGHGHGQGHGGGHGGEHHHDPIHDDKALNDMKKATGKLVEATGVATLAHGLGGAMKKTHSIARSTTSMRKSSDTTLLSSVGHAKIHVDANDEHGSNADHVHHLEADEMAARAQEMEMGEEEQAIDHHHHGHKATRINLDHVYLFKSPLLFNKTLDMTLLFNCFYLGVFCANYAKVSLDISGGWLYFLGIFIPPLINFVISGAVIKTMSILNAISELDGEVVGKVIDETEEMLNVQHEVFDVFRAKLAAIGLSKNDLGKLFKEIDADGSGEVDSKELRRGLALMGVHISGLRYKRLFRIVDKDRGGSISFEEFYALVYPDDTDLPQLSPRKD